MRRAPPNVSGKNSVHRDDNDDVSRSEILVLNERRSSLTREWRKNVPRMSSAKPPVVFHGDESALTYSRLCVRDIEDTTT